MRRILFPLSCALAFLALIGPCLAAGPAKSPHRAAGERRVALVVGNSAYLHTAPLANPANDARLMAEALKSLGFELVGGRALTDLANKGDMEQVVKRFGELVTGARVGLFYYAGHGVQVDGRNYLVPVAANVSAKAQVKYELLDVDFILDEMGAGETQVNVVVLDACRNNPFGGRGLRDAGSGLAQIMAPKGTLVAYSTAPGRTAVDGSGRNSPFTAALARNIKTPGLRLDDVFMRVGLEVERETRGGQSPWKSDNLRGVICLSGACGAAPAPVALADHKDQVLAQYARPATLTALAWEASWRLGSFRVQEARFAVDLDDTVKPEGSERSFRVDFTFPDKSPEMLACVLSRRKFDLAEFAGMEFKVRATQRMVGHMSLNTSHPDNPKLVDRFSVTFKADTGWTEVRIPFESLAVSRGWAMRHAAMAGFTPGDQLLRLNRVEELRIGVAPDFNPPGSGSIWINSIRFYK